MDYGIYKNKPTNEVTLHKQDCSEHQKHRKGAETPNGKWYPFSGTRDEAIAEQKKIAKPTDADTKLCEKCKP